MYHGFVKVVLDAFDVAQDTHNGKKCISNALMNAKEVYFCEFGRRTLVDSWESGILNFKMNIGGRIVKRAYSSYGHWWLEKLVDASNQDETLTE